MVLVTLATMSPMEAKETTPTVTSRKKEKRLPKSVTWKMNAREDELDDDRWGA